MLRSHASTMNLYFIATNSSKLCVFLFFFKISTFIYERHVHTIVLFKYCSTEAITFFQKNCGQEWFKPIFVTLFWCVPFVLHQPKQMRSPIMVSPGVSSSCIMSILISANIDHYLSLINIRPCRWSGFHIRFFAFRVLVMDSFFITSKNRLFQRFLVSIHMTPNILAFEGCF